MDLQTGKQEQRTGQLEHGLGPSVSMTACVWGDKVFAKLCQAGRIALWPLLRCGLLRLASGASAPFAQNTSAAKGSRPV